MQKKTKQFYIGAYFWWDYCEDWRPLVEMCKKYKLRFDNELKRWQLFDAITQYEIIEFLVEKLKKNPNHINVYNFESDELIQTTTWLNTIRQRKAKVFSPEIKSRLPVDNEVKLFIEPGLCRLKMPFKTSGFPKYAADYVLYGMAIYGCKGKIHADGTIHFNYHTKEACDYIINHTKTKVDGLPQLYDRPIITAMFSDFEVFKHQKTGIQFLYARERALLADDMGLGKTLQALLAAEQCRIDKEFDKLIIICPVSLVDNWWRECRKWETGFNIDNTIIIPYSMLHKVESLPEKCAIIMDECHYLKNPTSRRTECAINLIQKYQHQIKRLWLLSGTPVTKNNGDLWSLGVLLNHPISKEFSPTRLASMTGDKNAYISGALKTVMLMRKKEECLDLPPKLVQKYPVNLGINPDYSMLKSDSPEAIFEHLMKLKRLTAEAKVSATGDLVQELLDSGHKVVVFCEHTNSLHAIAKRFHKISAVLDGSTPQHERDKVVQWFQTDPECKVFCGNIKAAGVGITLTAATYAVFNSLTWLPSDLAQAEDRLHRIGQKGTVNIYRVTDESLLIDQIITRIVENRSTEIASFEGVKKQALKLVNELL